MTAQDETKTIGMTVFVDGDETLLETTWIKTPDQLVPPGTVPVNYPNINLVTIARPSALRFLQDLKAKGYTVKLLTANVADIQTQVLKVLGLLDDFIEVIGMDSPPQPPVTGPWVLVDNMFRNDNGIEQKFKQVTGTDYVGSGFDKSENVHFVHCAPYTGQEDPQALTRLCGEVALKLAKQKESAAS